MRARSTEENLAVPGEQWGGHHRDEKNPKVSLEGSSVTTIKLPEGVSKERVPLRVTPGWCNRVAVLVLARQASLNFPKNKNKSLPWWPARGSGWGKLTPLRPVVASSPGTPPLSLLLPRLLMSNHFAYRLPPRSASLPTGLHQPASSWYDWRGIQYRAEPWEADLKTSFGK